MSKMTRTDIRSKKYQFALGQLIDVGNGGWFISCRFVIESVQVVEVSLWYEYALSQ